MNALYFGCDWRVNSKEVPNLIDKLFANPLDLDYELVTFTGLKAQLDEEGYAQLYLVLRVPSQTDFDEFMKLARDMGFDKWYPVPEAHFLEGGNPCKLRHPFKQKYMESISEAGFYNDKLQKQLQDQEQ